VTNKNIEFCRLPPTCVYCRAYTVYGHRDERSIRSAPFFQSFFSQPIHIVLPLRATGGKYGGKQTRSDKMSTFLWWWRAGVKIRNTLKCVKRLTLSNSSASSVADGGDSRGRRATAENDADPRSSPFLRASFSSACLRPTQLQIRHKLHMT